MRNLPNELELDNFYDDIKIKLNNIFWDIKKGKQLNLSGEYLYFVDAIVSSKFSKYKIERILLFLSFYKNFNFVILTDNKMRFFIDEQ